MGFKMKKLPVYIILIALIAIFAAIATIKPAEDPYAIQSEGVLFKGSDASPLGLIPAIAAEGEFIVSAEIHDPVQQNDSTMFNGLALFLVVLEGNSKKTTQAIRVIDSAGNLGYCLTNYGDLKTEERITAEECNAMLNDNGKVVVLINAPNEKLPKPVANISGKRITIESNNFDSVNNACFTVLRAMFSNADEVLARSNLLTKKLG